MTARKASASKSVSVTYSERTDKKGSVRFDTDEKNAPMRTVYVTNDAMATLGNPDSITVTITAA